MKKALLILILILVVLVASYFLFYKEIDDETNNEKKVKATILTNFGNIELVLFLEQAPKTVANFEKLANNDFYQGTKFHRVIRDFMIQGGDPLSKDDSLKDRWGTGGPGYTFEDEIHEDNYNMSGTIAMANSGPDTNGSQFFINVSNNNFLDDKHTVFGKVEKGMDVVKEIAEVETGENDRPVEDVIVRNIKIVDQVNNKNNNE
ncbi:MAG TPA: peptidylprolyl isomerase [Candidatus Paceibacterota bacterium]|nr:peptidylprolyl isomerase [Candidatus Paceibacterota bacterium]